MVLFSFLVRSLRVLLHSPSSLALELNVLTFRASASLMRWHLVAGGEVCPTHRRQELYKVHICLCLGLSDWAQWAAEGAVWNHGRNFAEGSHPMSS